MTIFSVYPNENYNRGMGGNSNFARPMLPTYRGCTVYCLHPYCRLNYANANIMYISLRVCHYC